MTECRWRLLSWLNSLFFRILFEQQFRVKWVVCAILAYTFCTIVILAKLETLAVIDVAYTVISMNLNFLAVTDIAETWKLSCFCFIFVCFRVETLTYVQSTSKSKLFPKMNRHPNEIFNFIYSLNKNHWSSNCIAFIKRASYASSCYIRRVCKVYVQTLAKSVHQTF